MPSTTLSPARRWLLAALLVGATALAYLPTLRNGFVWDDDTSLTQNAFIKSGEGLRQFWLTTQTPDYWPVTSTSFWGEWRLWGLDPVGYHATNLALHLIEALLLWAVLRRLRIPGAYLAALLFAVHPVNVQTVAWITQRKNLMAMLFLLLSTLAFLRSARGAPFSGKGSGPKGLNPAAGFGPLGPDPFYAMSWLAFVLAMLSKGSAAVLPVVLLGIIAWERPVRVRDLVRLGPFFLVAGVLTLVDIWFQGHHLGATEVIRTATPVERLLGAGAVVWFYLGKALLPLHLIFVYPSWHIAAGSLRWWLPLLGALGMTGVLWWKARLRHGVARLGWAKPGYAVANSGGAGIWRGALFAWGYFCVALLPVMGFTDVYFMKFSLVADHYQHLALVGVTALAGAGWAEWRRRAPGPAPLAAAALLAGLFGVLTWRQCLRYRDAETLFAVTLRENPSSAMAHNNLGVILAAAGRLPEAADQFGAALRLDPGYADAERNFGLTLAREGRAAEAVPHYEQALRLQPIFATAEDDLGNALLRLDRAAEAIPHFEQAIRLSAGDAEAECNLGIALARLDRLEAAIPHYAEAVRLEPGNAAMHFDFGDALLRSGRAAAAAGQYEQVLRLRPNDAEARAALESARGAPTPGLGP
jgi:Flp pilus assembly protein TadD